MKCWQNLSYTSQLATAELVTFLNLNAYKHLSSLTVKKYTFGYISKAAAYHVSCRLHEKIITQ